MEEQAEASIASLKREVDALQVAVLAQNTPWYRSAATISAALATLIAALSLLFSFATNLESQRKDEQQQVGAAREELVKVLARLTDIPKEVLHARARYENDPVFFDAINAQISNELVVLTSQADFLLEQMPAEVVSAADYFTIAGAFQSALDPSRAEDYFRRSMTRARELGNFSIDLRATRAVAGMLYQSGDFDVGGQFYNEALDIFSRYTYVDKLTQDGANIQTRLIWGGSDMAVGRTDAARAHFDAAGRIAEALAPGPFATAQVNHVRRTMTAYGLGGAGLPPPTTLGNSDAAALLPPLPVDN